MCGSIQTGGFFSGDFVLGFFDRIKSRVSKVLYYRLRVASLRIPAAATAFPAEMHMPTGQQVALSDR